MSAIVSSAPSIAERTGFDLEPDKHIIPAPKDPALWPEFRQRLVAWRKEILQKLSYDDTLYERPEFAWSAAAYACYKVMIWDATFYDPESGRYTVDALLDKGQLEFGGFDSVVLWHAYPRIGVDQRNQYDFYRDMPGGLAAVREAVHAFQRRGVRVYINYNPWDTATRRESKPDLDMLAEMVRELDINGIFLDTMTRGGEGLRAKLDAVRPGVILEGEGSPPSDRVFDHHASWAQWFDDSEVPGVLRHKWMERRHMQHQIRRWDSDHSGELHTAWMNGSGMVIWENVFGACVPWNARDRSTARAMLPIQRRYTALFSGEDWTPLVPVEMQDVYASLWQQSGLRMWTLINRSGQTVEGTLLTIPAEPEQRYFDLIAGREIRPTEDNGVTSLAAAIGPRGLGCVLALPSADVDADLLAFVASQAEIHARASFDTTRPRREMRDRPIVRTQLYASAPDGMADIPFDPWVRSQATQIRGRECGYYDTNVSDDEGFRCSYDFRLREFTHPLDLKRFAMDVTPVTNAQFAEFLAAARYRPAYEQHFLDHWVDGKPPAAKSDHPVVWVSLDDARAYAAWAGKRLPTEAEWQHAAQGGDGREYPWGNGMRAGVCNLGETGDTTPVRTFPAGRSPAGCYDFIGNVWQWTESERTDGCTRFCMIRGGSYFAAQGSLWYVDGGPRQASFATKFILNWPGLDRCATIGFRCVVDLA